MKSIEISINFESDKGFKKGMKEIHSHIQYLTMLGIEVENNITSLKKRQREALINYCEDEPEYICMKTSVPKHLTREAIE